VVGILPADDQPLTRLTQKLVISMHKFDLCVVRLRSRVCEKNLVKVGWRHVTETRRQLDGRLVRAFEEIVVKRELH